MPRLNLMYGKKSRQNCETWFTAQNAMWV